MTGWVEIGKRERERERERERGRGREGVGGERGGERERHRDAQQQKINDELSTPAVQNGWWDGHSGPRSAQNGWCGGVDE